MKRQADVYDDPVEAFFDTLQLRPLPIQSERSDFAKIGRFGRIPLSVISQLGYPVDTRLKALMLPKFHGLHALLLQEQLDSITSNLYLYTLDRNYQPIDHLCSEYEVTILYIYESLRTHKTEAEQTRRFQLNADGFFEEVVIEVE